MGKLTRRSFLKVFGASASMIALQEFPSMTAFAEDGMIELDPDAFISEINAWYRVNNSSLTLEGIECESYRFSVEEAEKMIQDLQNIRITKSVEVIDSEKSIEDNVPPREIMPVSFSRTAVHTMWIYIKLPIYGELVTEVTVDGTIDILRNNIIGSSGSAIEKSSQNLDSVSFGSVSTFRGTPSDTDISYSVDCSAYFEWTDPETNIKYRVHDSDTFTGCVSY